ncbi:MAG: hypothetical protein ABI856_11420 [Nitrospira sp.]
MSSNVQSGIGCERDSQLRGGRRENPRTFNMGIPIERVTRQLGLSASVSHVDIATGDLVSIGKDGKIVPLDLALPFGGIIEKVGEDNLGRYTAGVITRCALCVKVHGLTAETRRGAKIYARPGPRTVFTVEEAGGVLVGEYIAHENMERSMGTVGVRADGDTRRFEPGGSLPGR